MCEGIFQKVKINSDCLKVNREVEGFHFSVTQLEGSDKIVLELLIPRKDGKEIRIEFEKLLPGWVLEKMSLDLEKVVESIFHSSDKEDALESILFESIDQFEDLLTLEIGEEYGDRVYFTIRFDKQSVSIWDRCLSEESLEGFIDKLEDRRVC